MIVFEALVKQIIHKKNWILKKILPEKLVNEIIEGMYKLAEKKVILKLKKAYINNHFK